jgi:hypothetical protein
MKNRQGWTLSSQVEKVQVVESGGDSVTLADLRPAVGCTMHRGGCLYEPGRRVAGFWSATSPGFRQRLRTLPLVVESRDQSVSPASRDSLISQHV